MIEKIVLCNFRGFKKIELPELKSITLFSGKNNAGKSSLLESIFLYMDHSNAESFSKIARFRSMSPLTEPAAMWEPCFFCMDTSNPIEIKLTLDEIEGALYYVKDNSFIPPFDKSMPQEIFNQFVSSAQSAYSLRFTFTYGEYKEEGHFVTSSAGILRNLSTSLSNNQVVSMPLTIFVNSNIMATDTALVEWMSKAELSGIKQQVINVLQALDPEITDIFTIVSAGQAQLYIRKGNGALPLKLAGDGMVRLLYIVLAIMENPKAIVLIDEIENGFHYSMYEKLWEIIAYATRISEAQVIATTHSYECIIGAVKGVQNVEMRNDFCYFRLEKDAGRYRSLRYSHDILLSAVEGEMEVR